jgi:hypothetical protein
MRELLVFLITHITQPIESSPGAILPAEFLSVELRCSPRSLVIDPLSLALSRKGRGVYNMHKRSEHLALKLIKKNTRPSSHH